MAMVENKEGKHPLQMPFSHPKEDEVFFSIAVRDGLDYGGEQLYDSSSSQSSSTAHNNAATTNHVTLPRMKHLLWCLHSGPNSECKPRLMWRTPWVSPPALAGEILNDEQSAKEEASLSSISALHSLLPESCRSLCSSDRLCIFVLCSPHLNEQFNLLKDLWKKVLFSKCRVVDLRIEHFLWAEQELELMDLFDSSPTQEYGLTLEQLACTRGAGIQLGYPTLIFDAGVKEISYAAADEDGIIVGGGFSPGLQFRLSPYMESCGHCLRSSSKSLSPEYFQKLIEVISEEAETSHHTPLSVFSTSRSECLLTGLLLDLSSFCRRIILSWCNKFGESYFFSSRRAHLPKKHRSHSRAPSDAGSLAGMSAIAALGADTVSRCDTSVASTICDSGEDWRFGCNDSVAEQRHAALDGEAKTGRNVERKVLVTGSDGTLIAQLMRHRQQLVEDPREKYQDARASRGLTQFKVVHNPHLIQYGISAAVYRLTQAVDRKECLVSSEEKTENPGAEEISALPENEDISDKPIDDGPTEQPERRRTRGRKYVFPTKNFEEDAPGQQQKRKREASSNKNDACEGTSNKKTMQGEGRSASSASLNISSFDDKWQSKMSSTDGTSSKSKELTCPVVLTAGTEEEVNSIQQNNEQIAVSSNNDFSTSGAVAAGQQSLSEMKKQLMSQRSDKARISTGLTSPDAQPRAKLLSHVELASSMKDDNVSQYIEKSIENSIPLHIETLSRDDNVPRHIEDNKEGSIPRHIETINEEDDIPHDSETMSKEDMSSHDNEAAPKEAAPKEAAPKEAAPKEAAQDAAPKDAAPKEAAPKEAAPKEAAPKEAAPKEAAPGEAAPGEAAPEEAAPEEDAPEEDAPEEDAPKEDAPKETERKEDIIPRNIEIVNTAEESASFNDATKISEANHESVAAPSASNAPTMESGFPLHEQTEVRSLSVPPSLHSLCDNVETPVCSKADAQDTSTNISDSKETPSPMKKRGRPKGSKNKPKPTRGRKNIATGFDTKTTSDPPQNGGDKNVLESQQGGDTTSRALNLSKVTGGLTTKQMALPQRSRANSLATLVADVEIPDVRASIESTSAPAGARDGDQVPKKISVSSVGPNGAEGESGNNNASMARVSLGSNAQTRTKKAPAANRKSKAEKMVGMNVAKVFVVRQPGRKKPVERVFRGRVESFVTATIEGEQKTYFFVRYEDNDSEHVPEKELPRMITLHKRISKKNQKSAKV